jgi:GlpG protein
MSGVVYGLLGYVWMMARFRPGEGLFMHPVTILTMMVWFFLGFFGLLGPIANTIHAVGLGLGLGWGLIESGGWRQIFQQ